MAKKPGERDKKKKKICRGVHLLGDAGRIQQNMDVVRWIGEVFVSTLFIIHVHRRQLKLSWSIVYLPLNFCFHCLCARQRGIHHLLGRSTHPKNLNEGERFCQQAGLCLPTLFVGLSEVTVNRSRAAVWLCILYRGRVLAASHISLT